MCKNYTSSLVLFYHTLSVEEVRRLEVRSFLPGSDTASLSVVASFVWTSFVLRAIKWEMNTWKGRKVRARTHG